MRNVQRIAVQGEIMNFNLKFAHFGSSPTYVNNGYKTLHPQYTACLLSQGRGGQIYWESVYIQFLLGLLLFIFCK